MDGDWYLELVKECEERFDGTFVMLHAGKFRSEREARKFLQSLTILSGSAGKDVDGKDQQNTLVKITQAAGAFHLTFAGKLASEEMGGFFRQAQLQGKRMRNAIGTKVPNSPLETAYQEARRSSMSGTGSKKCSLFRRIWAASIVAVTSCHPRKNEEQVFAGLVNGMVGNHGKRFVRAVTEAFALCEKGDTLGLCAIEESIRIRAGGKDVRFYMPGIKGRTAEEMEGAEGLLMALARNHILLADPAFSTSVMCCSLYLSNDKTKLRQHMISFLFDSVGADQAYAFQLLDFHSTALARLRMRLGDAALGQRIQEHTQLLSRYSDGPTYTSEVGQLILPASAPDILLY